MVSDVGEPVEITGDGFPLMSPLPSPHVIVIDNYDSFTFNLVQLLGSCGARVSVYLNDDCAEAPLESAAGLLLSPGPGRPETAGLCLKLLSEYAGRLPILGVCLGHQAIAEHAGGRLKPVVKLRHGKRARVHHTGIGLFEGLPSPLHLGTYNSLVVDEASLPDEVEVLARDESEQVMALRIRGAFPMEGVQFHPESILSECGAQLLGNWLRSLSSG